MTTQSEKLFIDLDEEITFVLEKIRDSKSDKVVLIVPKDANLTSSLISLKVLARSLTKLKKLVVLSVDDSLGMRLAKRSNLITVETPGDINEKIWALALQSKDEVKDKIERKKFMLLDRRDEKKGDDYKIVEEDSTKSLEVQEGNDIKNEESKNEDRKNEDEDEDEVKSIRPIARVPARVITVGTIKFYAAGDVLEDEGLLSELLPKENIKNEEFDVKDSALLAENINDGETPIEKIDYLGPDKKSSRFKRGSIIGTDYSSITRDRTKRSSRTNTVMFSGLGQILMKSKSLFSTLLSFFKNIKYISVIIAVIILVFLLIPALASSTIVEIRLKKDSLSINKVIKADPKVKSVNVATLEIPAETRSLTDSSSESGSATGVGIAGTKAEGILTVVNGDTTDFRIPKGTEVVIIASNLSYYTVSEVVVTGVSTKDVGILAAQPGEKYNAGVQKTFSIKGFDILAGKNLSPIQGGKTDNITIVSNEDMKVLKDIVRKRIESTAKDKLTSLVAANEILLQDTIVVDITSETPSKKVGEKTDKFDISTKATVSAYFIKKSDVEGIVKEIAKLNQKIKGKSQISIPIFPEITGIIFKDGIVTFHINSAASARADITQDTIRGNIEGKSMDESENYLKAQHDIDYYSIRYIPTFIPRFLQRVSKGNALKIKIVK